MQPPAPSFSSPTERFSRTKRLELTLAACICAVLVTEALYERVATVNLIMIYLLVVLVVAANLGRNAAILAVVLCVGTFDFLYVPPRFSFAITNFQYLITLGVMLATALLTAQLAANLRDRAREAQRRESNTQALYDLTCELAGARTSSEVEARISEFLRSQLGAQFHLLHTDAEGKIKPPADPPGFCEDLQPAREALENEEMKLVEPALDSRDIIAFLPLSAANRSAGVLALRFTLAPRDQTARQEALTLIQTVASIVSVVLDRIGFAEAAQAAAVETQAERLRSSILSALSHDVRTPLTAMVGLADSLFLIKPPLPPSALDTAQALREQSERLTNLVSNLLEMARLNAGEVRLRREWQPVEEVIGASLKLMAGALADHPVRLSIANNLPLVHIDAVLIERVLCNLIDNAIKYSPKGSTIEIEARLVPDAVEFSVSDRGSGFRTTDVSDLFRMFVRGDERSGGFGAGLGLAICKSIIAAHDGTIAAENREGGGARVHFTIALGEPPTIEEESS